MSSTTEDDSDPISVVTDGSDVLITWSATIGGVFMTVRGILGEELR